MGAAGFADAGYRDASNTQNVEGTLRAPLTFFRLLNNVAYVLCLQSLDTRALFLHTPKEYQDAEALRLIQVRLSTRPQRSPPLSLFWWRLLRFRADESAEHSRGPERTGRDS